MHCLLLLGKGEESALKVETLGCSETLAVVTRIRAQYNTFEDETQQCLQHMLLEQQTVPEQFSCHFLPSDKDPRTWDEAEWLHPVLSVK